MSEQPKQVGQKLSGDSTSQLVQISARDVGLKFTSSGNGAQDIRRLACEAYNNHLVTQALWRMCDEFAKALDAAGDTVPESVKVLVSIGILNARSAIDLGRKS